MKKLVLFVLFLSFGLVSLAQVQYSIEPKVKEIENDYIKAWEKVSKINGFRIQVMAFSGNNSRNRAESERAAIKENFPYLSVYLTYNEPYFKIRVGNYYTRLDAYKDLKAIQKTYPNAYIVPDKISYLDY